MKNKLLFLLGIFCMVAVINYCVPNLMHVNAHAESIQKSVNDGYVEPGDVTPASTVHVSDAKSFLDAIYRSHKGEGSSLGGRSIIHKIILDSDINLSNTVDNDDEGGLSYSEFGSDYDYKHSSSDDPKKNVNVKHGNLVIDGNGHSLDMMFNTIMINNGNEQWTLENMKILDSSIYGILGTFAHNNIINYRNISYYGSQLLKSNCITNIYGNVSVHSLATCAAEGPIASDKWYGWNGQSYENKGANIDGDQPNIKTNNIEFHANSRYFGETYDSDVLQISGNIKIDDNVQLDLHPHGNVPGNNINGNQPSSGINLSSNGKSDAGLVLGSKVQLNIFCNTKSLTDNKGRSVNSMDNGFISRGINATSDTNIQFNGTQSHLNIYGNGRVFNDKPLVFFDSMQANISGDGNELQVNEQNSNGSYNPRQGVMQINSSHLNVTNSGTLAMNVQIKRKNNVYDNQQLMATNSIININRPKRVTLSNYILDLSQHNRIIAQNVSVNAKRYNGSMQSQWGTDNTLIKYLQLPLLNDSGSLPSTYLMGGYFNIKQLVDGLKVDTSISRNNLYYLDFTGTQVPHIVLDDSVKKKTISTKNNEISGTVEDSNGNAIPNAYIKIHPDGTSDFFPVDSDSNNFYQSTNHYSTYINSQEVLFSTLKNHPSSLTESSNGAFRSLSDANANDAFELSHGYFLSHYNTGDYSDFNKYTTLYDESGKPYDKAPYVAISDAKGHFQFKVPSKMFGSFSNDKPQIDIVPSYNFTNGNPAQLNVNADNPKVNFVKNTINDITYPDGNSSDGLSLTKVFQGFPDSNTEDTDSKNTNPYIGDTINYHVEIKVSNTKNLITGTLHQPVPDAMDEKSLQVSYDNGKTYQPLQNYHLTPNSDGTKTIDISNIKDNNGNISLDLKGDLNNNHNTINNSPITFKPTFTYGDNKVVNSNENKIEFTDNSFTFKPHDINYGMHYVAQNTNTYWIYPINIDQPLITDIHDNRRNQQSTVSIFVQQTSNKFINDNDSKQTFIGHLIYDDKSLLQPVKVFTTNDHNNLYLNRHNPIYLSIDPTVNTPSGGNYSTQLQWTVNYGLH